MTGRLEALVLAAALPAAALASAEAAGSDGAICKERLARSLAEMESRPLLKEELATGLMWLRLDAEVALEAGDTALCLSKVETVETILGLGAPEG